MTAYKTDYESIRNIFWNGVVNGEQFKWDDIGIKKAIQRAFADLTARTMTRRTDNSDSDKIENKEFHEKICEKPYEFLNKIKEWFESDDSPTQTGYDKWHKEACDIIIKFLKTQYIETDAVYGKAQKIVNMTVKTLYCLEGAKEYVNKNKFDCCHMTLDSFTLEWFWRNCKDYAGCKRKNGKTDKKIYKGLIGSWSKIENPKDEDTFITRVEEGNKTVEKEFYTYDFFVKAIRSFFDPPQNEYKGLTPFTAEFYIWPEIQLHLAAEAVIFKLEEDYSDDSEEQLSDKEQKKKTEDKKKELKDLTIKEKLKKMKDLVDRHLNALELNSQ